MKLPKNYFENLTTSKYREYLKLLPDLKNEHTQIITMLIFTFMAMSFLGIFAINPTLGTIVELNKQVEDSTIVHEQLTTKMNNLSSLQQQHTQLTNDLPFVFSALPQTASVPLLVGQIEALAKEEQLAITTLRVSPVQLTGGKQSDKTALSYTFALETIGSYDQVMNFITALTKSNRIITLESVNLTKDPQSNKLVLSIRGREYFKK